MDETWRCHGVYYVTLPWWLRILTRMSEAFARWVAELGQRHAIYTNMDGVVVSSPYSRGRRQR